MDLVSGANLIIPSTALLLEIQVYGMDLAELDFSAYSLSQVTNKVRGDDDMVFYGQLHNQKKTICLDIATSINFNIDLPRIDGDIGKIAICVTMAEETKSFSELNYLDVKIKQGSTIIAKAKVRGANRSEVALIIGEIYKHKNDWKFRLVDQGFNGGLKPLAEYFGVEIAEESTQQNQNLEIIESMPSPNQSKSTLQSLLETPFKMIEKRKNLKTFHSLILRTFTKGYIDENDKNNIKYFCINQNLQLDDAMAYIKLESEKFILKASERYSKSEIGDWCTFLQLENHTLHAALRVVDRQLEFKFLNMLKKALSDGELNQQEMNELNYFINQNQLNQNELMQRAQHDISNFFHFNLASFVANDAISQEEEALIKSLCQYLKPSSALLNEINEIMAMVKNIEKIKKGDVTPIQTNEIIVKNSEIVFLHQKNVRIKVTQKEILSGDLFVTNERIVFKSSKAIETLISNIISVDLSAEYVEVIAKTKKGSGAFYIGKDANIVNAYIDQSVRRFHRQLDLKQTSGQTRHIPAHIKNIVWAKCQGKCVQCDSTMYLEFDHIIPFSKGGSNSENNLQILCRNCNLNKSDRI